MNGGLEPYKRQAENAAVPELIDPVTPAHPPATSEVAPLIAPTRVALAVEDTSPNSRAPESGSPHSEPDASTSRKILGSATLWFGIGNCCASFGVSWVGFTCNLALTPFYVWRDIRSSDPRDTSQPHRAKDASFTSLVSSWIKSPGMFLVIDGIVLGFTTADVVRQALFSTGETSLSVGALAFKSVSFALYTVGMIGAVADMNRDYWRKLGISDPIGPYASRAFSALPRVFRESLLCAGLWWGAGNFVMGSSELSGDYLARSPLTLGLFCAGIVAGLSAVVRGLIRGDGSEQALNRSQRDAYRLDAAGHLFYSLANLSVGNMLMCASFVAWTVTGWLFSNKTNKKLDTQPDAGK